MLSPNMREPKFNETSSIQKKENPDWSSLFKFVRNGITDYSDLPPAAAVETVQAVPAPIASKFAVKGFASAVKQA